MCSLPEESGLQKRPDVCKLPMSAGFDFPSFQLNWRYPAAMASLTLCYEARVDFLDRVEIGIFALSTTDLLSPNMKLLDLTGTPRYMRVSEANDLVCSNSGCHEFTAKSCCFNCNSPFGMPMGRSGLYKV